MKQLLLLFFTTSILILSAETAGKITFFMGTVEFQKDVKSPWIPADFDMDIDDSGNLKIGFDSEVEITWNNQKKLIITEEKIVAISTLLSKQKKAGSWDEKLKSKLATLNQENDSDAPDAVIAVRKNEVELSKKNEFYWKQENTPNINESIKLFRQGNYQSAIKTFITVLRYDPLSPNGHIARAYLSLCYAEIGNKQQAQQQLQFLKQDFPYSEFISIIENGLND